MFGRYKGADKRFGTRDRRRWGKWEARLWAFLILVAIGGGFALGRNLGAGEASTERAINGLSEGDSVRSQVILDSLLAFAAREPEVVERVVVHTVVEKDTVRLVDTLLVPSDPVIVRVRDTTEVLVIDTVFAPPQIITIPAPEYGFFSSEFFKPRAGNLLYLLGGVALGHLVSSDATACVLIATSGTTEKNCDPER